MSEVCAFCGKELEYVFARINDKAYCHKDPQPTCYMKAQSSYYTKEKNSE